jgi:hypothetical protein
MQTSRSLAVAGLTLAIFLALGAQAFSATVAVGTCTALPNYATINQALSAVPGGSTIKVCPGTYHEQVVIDKPLTLTGTTSGNLDLVVISPPATGLVANTVDVDNATLPIAAQILVQNTGPVTISNLTVDGTGNLIGGCAPDLQGILFQNASGTVNHVAVRNHTLGAGLEGCQSGESIFVQTATGMASTVTVQNSSVHNYNKNGITGNGPGTTLTVMGNYVQGSGVVPSGGAAQNGIQLGFGAKGKVSGNTVVDHIYGDETIAASADILLYDTAENSGIVVSNNTAGNSQYPIVLFTDSFGGESFGDGVAITGNKIYGTISFDAIDVCTSGNTIKTNTIANSAEAGVRLDATCSSGVQTTGDNNVVTGNTFVESACAGILADAGTSGNTTTPNMFYTLPFTVTSSTSHCTIPAGPASAAGAMHTAARAKRKYSPAR